MTVPIFIVTDVFFLNIEIGIKEWLENWKKRSGRENRDKRK